MLCDCVSKFMERSSTLVILCLVIIPVTLASHGHAEEFSDRMQDAATTRIGLALGGGGAKGLCHIAFIKALDAMGITPTVMAGTSIGALIGGFYAAGTSGEQMDEYMKTVKMRDLYKLVDFSFLRRSSVLTGKGVEAFLDETMPVRTFEELKIPLKIVATDFWKRQEVVFTAGELIPAIRASISIPAFFEPVILGDRVLIDGGAVNPLPYDLIREDCDILIAIDVSGEKVPPPEDLMPGMFESIMSTFQIMQTSIVESKKDVSQPDLSIKSVLKNIRVLEFYRYDEIMEGVKDEVERFKAELGKMLTEGKNR